MSIVHNVHCDYCGKKIDYLAGYISVDVKEHSPIDGTESRNVFRGEFCNKSCFLLNLTVGCW